MKGTVRVPHLDLQELFFENPTALADFLASPRVSPRSIGGLVEVNIGCYQGLNSSHTEACFAHVFPFVVVQSVFGTSRIFVCDRGEPCQPYAKSHVERELKREVEGSRLLWAQYVSKHAQAHPGASMKAKVRDWRRSRPFAAWVTVLMDDGSRYKLSKLESMHHQITSMCAVRPTLKRTIGRLFEATVFDQQEYPVCWVVSVVWLLALLPRLTLTQQHGSNNKGIDLLVKRVMTAKTMDRWVEQVNESVLTRRAQRTMRMPSELVDGYNAAASPHTFDMRPNSGGGFANLLLKAALKSLGITWRAR